MRMNFLVGDWRRMHIQRVRQAESLFLMRPYFSPRNDLINWRLQSRLQGVGALSQEQGGGTRIGSASGFTVAGLITARE
jgi:hypothetical protein